MKLCRSQLLAACLPCAHVTGSTLASLRGGPEPSARRLSRGLRRRRRRTQAARPAPSPAPRRSTEDTLLLQPAQQLLGTSAAGRGLAFRLQLFHPLLQGQNLLELLVLLLQLLDAGLAVRSVAAPAGLLIGDPDRLLLWLFPPLIHLCTSFVLGCRTVSHAAMTWVMRAFSSAPLRSSRPRPANVTPSESRRRACPGTCRPCTCAGGCSSRS